MKKTLVTTLIASGIALATLSGAAHAKGRLVVYCSATNEMCEAETKAFGEKYDVKTSFIRNGSGSTLAKVDAERHDGAESARVRRWRHGVRRNHSPCYEPIRRRRNVGCFARGRPSAGLGSLWR